jgi:hypothetical protein
LIRAWCSASATLGLLGGHAGAVLHVAVTLAHLEGERSPKCSGRRLSDLRSTRLAPGSYIEDSYQELSGNAADAYAVDRIA